MRSSCFRALPFNQWPAGDKASWLRALQAGDALDDSSLGANWRPATWNTTRDAYAIGLGWLTRRGMLDPAQAPEVRWTPERLRDYIADLKSRVSVATVRHRIARLERG